MSLDAEIYIRTSPVVAQDIFEAANAHVADLIVVGKHGQGWVESITIGLKIANTDENAPRPVLVVPPQESEI